MLRFYLSLALKNLLRHKRRTILTALAIAVAIFYYIILDSLLSGADRDAIKNLIDLETSHLQVSAAAAEMNARPDLKNLLPNGDTLAKRISALREVERAVPRLLFPATIFGGLDEMPVTGVGVDPVNDPKVFTVNEFVQAGRWLRPEENTAVVGKRIAELLEIDVGDIITLRTQTKTMTFQALDLTVVGLVASPHPMVNQNQIFLPLGVAQDALGVDNAVSTAPVRVRDGADLATVAERIRRLDLGATPFKVETWETASSFLVIGSTKRSYGGAFLMMVFLISTIGIVNSILLSTLERVREIGIMKAMGMKESGIIRLFAYEAFCLGLLGGSIGVGMATIANVYLVNVGIDFTAMMGDIDIGYPIAARFYGAWNWSVTLWASLFGVIASLAASYLPARKAARLDAVECLRQGG